MQVAQMTGSDISNSPGVYGQFYASHSDSTCAPNFKQEPIINPSIPKSDSHLISSCNITPKSNTKFVRIKEMITN